MSSSDNILLLTGTPGIGKTTVIKKAAASLADLNVSGFFTEEIRFHKVRQGFALVTINEKSTVMAHIDSGSDHRVGKYGVDVAAIDQAVRMTLAENSDIDLFIIDEIGKMECFSELFVEKVTALFDSGKTIVATIASTGSGFIAEMKNRPGIELWVITMENRDEMVKRVVAWVRSKKSGMRRRVEQMVK